VKLGANGDISNKGKAAVVTEEDESEFAGPELPPNFDQEDVPDDEEGRFFGGGVRRETARAMDYLDQQDNEETAVRKHFKPWAYLVGLFSQLTPFVGREDRRCLDTKTCGQFRKADFKECRTPSKV
jgi:hypothetical protein